MASGYDTINLEDTRVSILIPLAAIAVLGGIQLALGTDPLIMAMCAISVAAPLIPLHLYGRDLYAMIGITFSLRYIGVALIAKTLYGQPLEKNLFDPYPAFEWTTALMLIVTVILLIARALDTGKTWFPFPTDLRNLRRLSVLCFVIGLAAELIVGATKPTESSAGGGGPLLPVASAFGDLVFLAMIAEVIYAIKKSNGRSFITPFLGLMLVIALAIVLALNMRGFLINCLICIVTTAFMFKALRLRHLVFGLVFGLFFTSVLTPITLYLRMQREGMPKSQFLQLVEETVVKAATDPSFFKGISDAARFASFQNIKEDVMYDYYGDRTNVLNRLSFIGLLDTVAYASKSRNQIGMTAVKQSLSRNAPGFLGFTKAENAYGFGDWLSWYLDLGETGITAFLNFGLPMEGLVTWGWIGFVTYPFIFILSTLFICGRISSLKLALPTSIFLFTAIQTGMIEDTSDAFFGLLNRGLPMFALSLFILQKALFPRRADAKPASIAASTTN